MDGVLRPHADTHLPLTPQPPGQATANDEEEQNLYVPPMSPQKRESIERWLDLLPPPSELARDVLDNPVVPEVPETAASEHSSAYREGPSDERRSSLTAEHLKHHTRALSGKGRTPTTPMAEVTAGDTIRSDTAHAPPPDTPSMSTPSHTPHASFTVPSTTHH